MSEMAKRLKTLSKSMTLMLVDDEEVTRELGEQMLAKYFRSITTAEHALDALSKYKEGVFDLIITDIRMPKMDGIQLSKEIKNRNPDQMILIFSAYSEIDYLIELMNAGVDGFLLKPMMGEGFLKNIHKACKHIHNRKMKQEFQQKLEESYIDLMEKEAWLRNIIEQTIVIQNQSIAMSQVIKKDAQYDEAMLKCIRVEHVKISASDFIELHEGDLEHTRAELCMISENMEVIISRFSHERTRENLLEVADAFTTYAVFLSSINEFMNLSCALGSLGKMLANEEMLERSVRMSDWVLKISEDLKKWQKAVFHEQEVDNIHFMDNDIITNCVMVESYIMDRPLIRPGADSVQPL